MFYPSLLMAATILEFFMGIVAFHDELPSLSLPSASFHSSTGAYYLCRPCIERLLNSHSLHSNHYNVTTIKSFTGSRSLVEVRSGIRCIHYNMASTGMEKEPTRPKKHAPTPFAGTANKQMQMGVKHREQSPLVMLDYLDEDTRFICRISQLCDTVRLPARERIIRPSVATRARSR